MITIEQFRALFPSAETCVHLNHAGVSPIALPVAEAVRSAVDGLMTGNILTEYFGHMERQEALRQGLGRMMQVAPTTLGFVRNTSHGLSIAADSIPFQPGDTVVVPQTEYPANVYPWMAQERRGVRVHLVPPSEGGLFREEDLMAACDAAPSTRVLALSWVHWGTGQRFDLQRLGDFCHSRGILFVVDLIQALGALRLNLGALPIDIAAAGCQKWLMAPSGLGFLYVRPEVFPTLLPVNIGSNSVERPMEWERLHFNELKPNPGRFEEGSPALLATSALNASVSLLESVGFDAVHDRVLAIADYTRRSLAAHGMTVMSPDAPAQQSGIVAFRHPALTNDDVLARLEATGVRCAVRCGNIRFAPHAYIGEADIDRAIGNL